MTPNILLQFGVLDIRWEIKMSGQAVIFFLMTIIIILICIIWYQRFVFKKGIQAKLKQIIYKLEDILETDSEEKLMVFAEDSVLMELEEKINLLLRDRQKAKVEFRRSEIASKKMLVNISHDIKTPLTVILGYLEIMRITNIDADMLKKVELKAKQVMELINQFFTLAKLEAGDTNITLSMININEICKESVLSFYEILLQKAFKVDISIPDTAIYIKGDKDALERILFNLLSNVIRYGSDGKYLGVSIYEDKFNAYIDIVDKGKGIKKEFASCVFERLYTMEDSRNREVQGNGLGLTIAKNLAVQLGGDIYLDSIPNIKTTFTVKLKKINY